MKKDYLKSLGFFVLGVIFLTVVTPSQEKLYKEIEELRASSKHCETSVVELEEKRQLYEKIIEVDNIGFGYCSDAMNYCSDGFTGVANADVGAVSLSAENLTLLVPSLKELADKRQELLLKLE